MSSENNLKDSYERIPAGIKASHLSDAIAHAMKCFPEECCGVFTTQGYKPLTNVAEDKINHFVFKENQLIAGMSDEIICLFHSHTTGNAWANKHDMLTQIVSAKPHGICVVEKNDVSGKMRVEDIFFWGSDNISPLLGRSYRPCTMDCYSLIRDAYFKWYGIKLPEFPRNYDSIDNGENLYETGLSETGFVQIPIFNLAPGDVLLGKILSTNINHGAVVIDNRSIMHHYRDEVSRRDDLSRWCQTMNICLRHKSFSGLPPLPPVNIR